MNVACASMLDTTRQVHQSTYKAHRGTHFKQEPDPPENPP